MAAPEVRVWQAVVPVVPQSAEQEVAVSPDSQVPLPQTAVPSLMPAITALICDLLDHAILSELIESDELVLNLP
jgi:hypothetical protein